MQKKVKIELSNQFPSDFLLSAVQFFYFLVEFHIDFDTLLPFYRDMEKESTPVVEHEFQRLRYEEGFETSSLAPSYWNKFKKLQKRYQILVLALLTFIIILIILGICLDTQGSQSKSWLFIITKLTFDLPK